MVNPNGRVQLCCVSPHDGFGSANALDEAWNNDTIRHVREQMIKGEQVSYCSICYQREALGRNSPRNEFNGKWANDPEIQQTVERSIENEFVVDTSPRYLDLRFGNLCNLVCKMCWGNNSSQIEKDHKRLFALDPDGFQQWIGDKPQEFDGMDWYNDQRVWEILDTYMPNLTDLYLTGGEPTMIQENSAFLQKCVDRGYSKNITVRYNTNATNVNPTLLELSKHFKKTVFACSIDGTGLVQEYIRPPSKWSSVFKNIMRLVNLSYSHPIVVRINMTVQVYNIVTLTRMLDELWELLKDHGVGIHGVGISVKPLLKPYRHNLQNLPTGMKAQLVHDITEWKERTQLEPQLLNGLDSIITQLETDARHHMTLEDYLGYADFVDQNKSVNIRSHLPELVTMLETYADRRT